MRYFVNNLSDYVGGKVEIDVARWKRYVLQTFERIRSRMPPALEYCDGGLYVGCAGVAYACYHIGRAESFSDHRNKLMHAAVEYLDVSLAYGGRRRSSGRGDPPAAFLLGPGGVLAVGGLIYDFVGRQEDAANLKKRYTDLAKYASKPGNYLGFGSDELFVGRAGYVCGALNLNCLCKEQVTRYSCCT